MSVPRILVIDDQITARPDLRLEYCDRWGVFDAEAGDPGVGDALASVRFCSGQERADGGMRNSLDVVERAVRSGWPSPEGWRWALVLLDVRFDAEPPTSEDATFGFRVLDLLAGRWQVVGARTGVSDLPVVMLSTVDRGLRAGDAGRCGAREYVEKKDLDADKIRALLQDHGLIEDDVETGLIGRSLPMLTALREARRIARVRNGNAMILGPPGSGKSSLAQYIHRHSGRPGQFVPYFPTSSAEELEYLALFGCWKGAHSTATESYAGKAEQAHRGTLLVDEVHHLGAKVQQELLEFGRPDGGQRWVTRLGKTMPKGKDDGAQAKRSVVGQLDESTSRIAVDVLLLSASNEPIDDASWRERNRFSEALYTRLAVEYGGAPLHFPSLAERIDDVDEIFQAALARETAGLGGRAKHATDRAVVAELKSYSWPRNVAELLGVARQVAWNAKDFEEVSLVHFPRLDSIGRPKHAVVSLSGAPTGAVASPVVQPPGENVATDASVRGTAALKEGVDDNDIGPLTLANLSERVRKIRIDKDDPALEGIKPRLETALRELLQRCAGAALARWTKPDGKIDRMAAIRLIAKDAELDKSDIPREIKRILGVPLVPTKVTDEEIQQLLDAWAQGEASEGSQGAESESAQRVTESSEGR